jgi:hypothetical protein
MPSYEKRDYPTEWTIWCDEDEDGRDGLGAGAKDQQPSATGDESRYPASPSASNVTLGGAGVLLGATPWAGLTFEESR